MQTEGQIFFVKGRIFLQLSLLWQYTSSFELSFQSAVLNRKTKICLEVLGQLRPTDPIFSTLLDMKIIRHSLFLNRTT